MTLFTVSFFSKSLQVFQTNTFQTKAMAFKAARMLASKSFVEQVKVFQGQAGGLVLKAF